MTKEELSANVIKTKNLDKVVDEQTLLNKKYIFRNTAKSLQFFHPVLMRTNDIQSVFHPCFGKQWLLYLIQCPFYWR